MSDYLRILPVELVFKILDNVPSVDILSSVCFVNKRLRLVSLSYPRFQLNFSCMDTSMDKSQFDTICRQLLYSTSQVESLTLFDENDPMMSLKNAVFFSRFNISDKAFPNLRSLTLTYIEYNTWCLFKTRLPPHIMTFSICLYSFGCIQSIYLKDACGILSELIFLSPLLQRLSVKMAYVYESILKIRPPNSSILSSIQYLHVEGAPIDLFSLLPVTPMLHTLECEFQTLRLKLGIIYPHLMYLQQLRIKLWAITWKQMENLISSYPRLVYLVIIAGNVNSNIANGFKWARLLQEIKKFEFKFEFSYDAFHQEPFNLDSFRTKFWLEEKKWFVTYDRSSLLSDCSKLYSNPSSIIVHPPHEIHGTLISESTASELESFSHVHCLTIDDQYLKYSHLNRYKHINELYLSEVTTTYPTTFNDLMTCIDTSQIIKCTISFVWSRNSFYEYIEFLRSLPRLRRLRVFSNLSYFFLHQWPHIVDLKIEDAQNGRFDILSSNDIDALCHSFPHIKQLDIYSSSITDLSQLLNKMKMILTNIIIRQSHMVKNKQFITRQWIEQNTELKNFHYESKRDPWNSVILWL